MANASHDSRGLPERAGKIGKGARSVPRAWPRSYFCRIRLDSRPRHRVDKENSLLTRRVKVDEGQVERKSLAFHRRAVSHGCNLCKYSDDCRCSRNRECTGADRSSSDIRHLRRRRRRRRGSIIRAIFGETERFPEAHLATLPSIYVRN